jgi:hypothetical protein
MKTIDELMQLHFEIWSERDHVKRRKAINEVYSENCHIYDPFYANIFVGQNELMKLIDDVQGKFSGFDFTTIPGSLNEHHGCVRISWNFGPSDSPRTITGQDFILVENGLIQSVTVFIDEPTE